MELSGSEGRDDVEAVGVWLRSQCRTGREVPILVLWVKRERAYATAMELRYNQRRE